MGTDERIHEPRLRELAAELRCLRELIDERDQRYTERFTHQKELNTQSFAASEKAIGKAEEAQQRHNEVSNEFRQQLKDQNETQMPRIQAESENRALRERVDNHRNDSRKDIEILRNEITELRESRSELEGRREQQGISKNTTQWALSFALGLLGLIMGLLMHKAFGQ